MFKLVSNNKSDYFMVGIMNKKYGGNQLPTKYINLSELVSGNLFAQAILAMKSCSYILTIFITTSILITLFFIFF